MIVQIISGVQRASIIEDDAVEDLITFPNGRLPANVTFSSEVNSPTAAITKSVKVQNQNKITSRIRANLTIAQESYQQAKRLVVKENIAEAINSFQAAIEAYPNYAAAHHDLGMVFWQEEKYELAKECFERVISLDRTSASAQLNLGNVWRQQQQLERAILAYQTAVKINPHYAPAWHNLGLVYQDRKQLDLAELAFIRAIKADEKYFFSYLELGKLWDITDRVSNSKKLYQEALKRNPNTKLKQQLINLLKLAEIKLGNRSDEVLYSDHI